MKFGYTGGLCKNTFIFLFIFIPLLGAFFACSAGRKPPAPESAQTAPEPSVLESDSNFEYAGLIKGTPVYATPGRSGARIALMPFGEKCEILETRDAPYREISETWARLRWADKEGWALSYYLSKNKGGPLTEGATAEDITGSWDTLDGNSFTFNADGTCNVDFREDSLESQMLAAAYYKHVLGYSWRQEGAVLIIDEEYEDSGDDGADPGPDSGPTRRTDELLHWHIVSRSRVHITADGDEGTGTLFRDSSLRRAVIDRDLNSLYLLLENTDYAPADFDRHLYSPEEEAGRSFDLSRDKGTTISLGSMPLLAIALSSEPVDLHAARLLVDHGAEVNSTIQLLTVGYGLQSGAPLIVYFYDKNNAAAVDFLLENEARLDPAGSGGHSFYDLIGQKYLALRYALPNEGLNLRDAPTTQGKIVAVIPKDGCIAVLEETGDEVTLLGRTGRWGRVMWGDKTGWAFGGLLR